MNNNILMKTDAYKITHFNQVEEGTEYDYRYIAPRHGPSDVVITGISQFCREIAGNLWACDVAELVEIAEDAGIPFNYEGWGKLLDKYGETKEFPLLVRGVPEGTVVPVGTVVATVVNTDPEFYWLPGFFEALFLRSVWYPSTVASISRECKKVIKEGMQLTCDNLDALPYKLVDFGSRGVGGGDSAAVGGCGHLINFDSTDNLEAVKYLKDTYGIRLKNFSIAATEHGTVTPWGQANEIDMYRNFIKTNLRPGKAAACVSDSYNIWEALKMWKTLEPELKESGGTLIVRPDSGNPVKTPVNVVKELLDLFGWTVNSKGYGVLPDYIRVIQGDGIDLGSIKAIINALTSANISLDNIAFGMGGGLLQHCDRDTYGWAMKSSAVRVKGTWKDVYKDPLGGTKTSLRGLVTSGRSLSYESNAVWDRSIIVDSDYGWVSYYNGHTGFLRPVDSWYDIQKRAAV